MKEHHGTGKRQTEFGVARNSTFGIERDYIQTANSAV
jgi:hypothetical protein